MRTVFKQLLVVSLLMTALVACIREPVPVDPPIDETPIKSALGTPVGTAFTQTIDATGGTFSEVTTGVTVKAFAGTVDSSAQVKVQPITNTLPDGIGMGVEISSNQPLKKQLIVRFSYDASEPDPNSLRLAVQADDGSWFSLAPVKIDTVNKTVSAALPDSLPVTNKGSSRVMPMGGSTNTWRVVKYLAFYMKPKSATVKVGKSVVFVPYARVEWEQKCDNDPPRPPTSIDDDQLACLKPSNVVKEYPFTNSKAGFVRNWSVNGVVGGDSSTVGTVKPNASVGATYTAPANAPTPSTVTVSFESTNTQTNQKLVMVANVTVGGAGYKVVGKFSAAGYPACYGVIGIADMTDQVEFRLEETGNNKMPYEVQGIQNQLSETKNFRGTTYTAGSTVTQTSPSEVLNATGGDTQFLGTPETVTVALSGGSWSGGCTITYPDGSPPFVYPPGDTFPSSADFTFNLNAFVNNSQKVIGDDPSSPGAWEFTITTQ